MKYIREIDVLRAIAVLSVIFFHYQIPFFNGGYVGVDIFFVISGFLITNIILKRMQNNKFLLTDFYKKRAGRILPVLFFIIIFSNFFFLNMNLSEQEVNNLKNSSLASLLFYSNIYFFFNSGYFALTSELQPLIHTWSLAVEEQFYIFFPIFLIVVLNYKKIKIGVLILSIVILFIFLTNHLEKIVPTLNFYSPISRSWELLIGSLVSIYFDKINYFFSKKQKVLLFYLGFILISYSIITFDKKTPYPSLYSLSPVIGSALIILFYNFSGILKNIFQNKILIFLGLISYSLYLWHQPIMVFIKYNLIHPFYYGVEIKIVALAVVFIFSYLTYRFIETPFRKKNIDLKYFVFFLIFYSIGTLTYYHFYDYKNVDNYKLYNHAEDLAKIEYNCDYSSSGCRFGNTAKKKFDLLLLGNSHARMLIPNLDTALKKLNLNGYHPDALIYNILKSEDDLGVSKKYKKNIEKTYLNKICELSKKSKMTILSYRFTKYLNDNLNYFYNSHSYDNEDKKEILLQRINHIKNCSNKMILIGPVPDSPVWGPNINRINVSKVMLKSSLEFFYNKNKDALDLISKINSHQKNNKNFHIIQPYKYLCNRKTCSFISDDDISNYYDDNHLSNIGSKGIVEEITSLLID